MSRYGVLGEEKMRKTRGEIGPGSPRNKVKFLCSYGGKILPRPSDNHLKYVGGETRVISVPRDIVFSELMKKLTSLIEGEMILKYQLLPEELDALVSVKSDKDLRHMFDECERHSTGGTPRLRAFLFPANPTIIENQEPQALEQRYIDAINGIIRSTTLPLKLTTGNASYSSFSISSPCSSPRSTDSYTTENFPPMLNTKSLMPRVHSSPNIRDMSTLGQNVNNHQQPQQNQHYHYYKPTPLASQSPHLYHHHHYQQQYQQPSYLQSSKPPLDQRSNFAPEKFTTKVRSIGRSMEASRYDVTNVQNHYHSRQQRGGTRCIQYDDYGGAYGDGRMDNRPLSPHPRSPLQGYSGAKAWDNAL